MRRNLVTRRSIMEQILLKAYVEGIVESLKERNGGNSFATGDVREENYSPDLDILQFDVKFYWDTTGPYGVPLEHSMSTVVQFSISREQVRVGDDTEWRNLTPGAMHGAADWIVQWAFGRLDH